MKQRPQQLKALEELPTGAAPLSSSADILEAIYNRRAVRRYQDKPVAAGMIEELLSAAVQAPSAMNGQPWAFVIVQNENLLKKISRAAQEYLIRQTPGTVASEHARLPFMQEGFDIFYGARTLVVICTEKKEGFQPIGDCYLAAQNLMLASVALGLGSCPIGFARDVLNLPEFTTELSIPENYQAVLPIVLGYPEGFTERAPRKPPLVLRWVH